MQRIAQDWVVLSMTNSPTAVGITTALQFLPMLLVGLYGGVLADRYPKRRLLLITQSVALVLAVTLAVLALTGRLAVWHIWLLAFLLGLDTVVDNPTRQAFVNEMVGPRHLRNAISLNSSIFQLGGLLGPALAGILINAVGAGAAFAINAGTYLPVLVALAAIKPSPLHASPSRPDTRHAVRESLRHVAREPLAFWPIVLVGFVGSIGLNMPIVLSAYAKNVFHTGAAGYGLLSAMVAVGSMLGALRSASRPASRLRQITTTAGLFGAAEAAAALMPDQVALAVALIAVGALALTFLTAANAMVQTSVNDGVRGRVMGLYILVLVGGTTFGGPIVGFIAAHAGPRAAMVFCGAVPALAAAAVAATIARRAELRLQLVYAAARARPAITIVPRATADGERDILGPRAGGVRKSA